MNKALSLRASVPHPSCAACVVGSLLLFGVSGLLLLSFLNQGPSVKTGQQLYISQGRTELCLELKSILTICMLGETAAEATPHMYYSICHPPHVLQYIPPPTCTTSHAITHVYYSICRFWDQHLGTGWFATGSQPPAEVCP